MNIKLAIVVHLDSICGILCIELESFQGINHSDLFSHYWSEKGSHNSKDYQRGAHYNFAI